MSYGFAVLKSSDIPRDWKCVICGTSEENRPLVAHVRYIQKMDGGAYVYSNGGENHPVHQSCLLQAFVNSQIKCFSCEEELYDKKAFFSSRSTKQVTRSDGTKGFLGQMPVPFFPCPCPLKELPPFILKG